MLGTLIFLVGLVIGLPSFFVGSLCLFKYQPGCMAGAPLWVGGAVIGWLIIAKGWQMIHADGRVRFLPVTKDSADDKPDE